MGDHLVRFYDDDSFIVDEIWRFIHPGLEQGETAIVIATQAHLDALAKAHPCCILTASPSEAEPGLVIGLDAGDTLSRLLVDGWPEEARFMSVIGELMRQVTKSGRRHTHVYGEMVASLCAEGNPAAAIRLEHLWSALSRVFPFSLLCGYPMHAFPRGDDTEAFGTICNAHTHVLPAESFHAPACTESLHRTIAKLQQKANALESEIARRKAIEQALHAREQDLSDFLENALEGMHRVRADGTIIWANKAELDLLGYARDEYVGHDIKEFHVDRPVIAAILAKLLNGETLYDEPARLRCKDGSIRHVLIRSNATVVDGEFVSTRCITRDVTDRIQLEAALNQKLSELADVDRRKDEFLAMLGHELRNPLAPIVNCLEMMRIQADYPAQLARSRDTIARQVSLMTRLVDDLLDVSRITRGKITLKQQDVMLDEIIERALDIARPLIEERCHRLSLNLPAGAIYLYGDPARLAQALANLLHNAAKYTEPNGDISLTARIADESLTLVVGDNGIGVDRDLQDKVFDLFVQDAKSLNKAHGGLGLGLTLVRSLVQLHGGSVSVHSEGSGRGSEFLMTLPLRTSSTYPASRPPAAAHTRQSAESHNILIVDDNIDAAESLGEFLKISGHRIALAHDGANAIRLAARSRPDVVVLDIGMPGMDGYRVAQHLREEVGLASSLLIAVTGYAQERDRLLARQAGFDHHFAKPIDIPKLMGILNQPVQ